MAKAALHPKARAEMNAAASHYRREAGRDVAARFLAEVNRCAVWLLEHPLGAPPAGPEGVRKKVLLDHFPYTLYYVITPRVIRIVVIAHQRQDVGDFSDRLKP